MLVESCDCNTDCTSNMCKCLKAGTGCNEFCGCVFCENPIQKHVVANPPKTELENISIQDLYKKSKKTLQAICWKNKICTGQNIPSLIKAIEDKKNFNCNIQTLKNIANSL